MKYREIRLLLASFFLVCVATACRNTGGSASEKAEGTDTAEAFATRIVPEYAEGFRVTYADGVCLLDIQDPQKEESTLYRYALVPRGTKPQGIPAECIVIETPVRSVICMTSLQLSNFIKLDALEVVAGITSTRHLYNEEMHRRLETGLTHKIGIEGNFDNEVIMSINPDLILISPFKRGGYEALKDVGIPLIPHLGYKEMTPLGQAEWMKFAGLLLGQEEKANAQFAAIEQRYNELKDLVKEVKDRPVVFSGVIFGGNWSVMGGKSFIARLLMDAGADYFLKDNDSSGDLKLDYETVYSRAAEAAYWHIVNRHPGKFSYKSLKEEDPRYADFKAYKDKKIVYCDIREKPYYESMPVEPELVLADLIKVFYPQLLPDYEPKYYELLK